MPKALKAPWLKLLVDTQLAGVTSKARNLYILVIFHLP
ncbi:hypothetical protein PARC_a0569 [Pseudoalteromonas arctica A 37-1-2]|uniref:Uncharacterized protein n=1 Tax=Pseudoalteromonas arctica A 37-1-2 TaxID=1117313 RepID=A0A290RZN4_9GAMM|nr:hypothetical protein PARC_a0569 [Pseudoalteromonas arctica A 37-1-2]